MKKLELRTYFLNEETLYNYKEYEFDKYFNNEVVDKFKDGTTQTRIKQTLYDPYPKSEYVFEGFSKIKNKKKPTEVLIFTDGFTFSAGSIFVKSLYNAGAAITVGYGGDPESLDAFDFDASQSPTAVLNDESLPGYSDAIPEVKELNEFGYDFRQLSYMPLYKTYYDEIKKELEYPEEFTINPVDERVDIFSKYTDENYNLFIDKAKEIFEKYKTHCNPNNTNLKLVDDKCYTAGMPIYTHGAYSCGEDGFWNKNESCNPSYCDKGFFFDKIKNKCIRDEIYQWYQDDYNKNIIKELQKNNTELQKEIDDLKEDKDDLNDKVDDQFVPAVSALAAISAIFGGLLIFFKCKKKGVSSNEVAERPGNPLASDLI